MDLENPYKIIGGVSEADLVLTTISGVEFVDCCQEKLVTEIDRS